MCFFFSSDFQVAIAYTHKHTHTFEFKLLSFREQTKIGTVLNSVSARVCQYAMQLLVFNVIVTHFHFQLLSLNCYAKWHVKISRLFVYVFPTLNFRFQSIYFITCVCVFSHYFALMREKEGESARASKNGLVQTEICLSFH